jgi:hypothetical protein
MYQYNAISVVTAEAHQLTVATALYADPSCASPNPAIQLEVSWRAASSAVCTTTWNQSAAVSTPLGMMDFSICRVGRAPLLPF